MNIGNLLIYGVDKVTSLEPFNNEIVSEKRTIDNDVYTGLISIMKESMQVYYNMRMGLGSEVVNFI